MRALAPRDARVARGGDRRGPRHELRVRAGLERRGLGVDGAQRGLVVGDLAPQRRGLPQPQLVLIGRGLGRRVVDARRLLLAVARAGGLLPY